ncbi:MAG: galactose mutarotase [Cyanobacteriota bacterium]|nr:galactose mutarotase [Cyanobacteriota bacterium]
MTLTREATPYPHWRFTHPASGDTLRLAPERGGLVTGWTSGGREWLYLDEARFADPALSVRGGIPVLFPICGNLPGDRLPLPQGDATLRQHGFARDRPWDLEPLADGEGVALILVDDDTTRAAYPFAFQVRLEARLGPGRLTLTTRVSHTGPPEAPPMPFSLGFHPYFRVADPAAVRLEGFPERCFDHLSQTEVATASQWERLGAGVDLLARPLGPVVTLRDPLSGTSLELELSAPLDRVVVWTDPPRPMVCLEPWSGPRGALISGDGRLTLAPGERCELRCAYRVATD